jgi:hypothetical protein
MSLAHLVTCPSCSRHVRASEGTCPFCSTAVPDAVRAILPRRPPTERMSRAALYAFGVGSVAVAAACGSTSSGPPVGETDAAHDSPAAQPLYGGGPAYGAPGHPLPEAGLGDAETDAGLVESGVSDAGGGFDVVSQPFYGAAQQDASDGNADGPSTPDSGERDALTGAAYGLSPGNP